MLISRIGAGGEIHSAQQLAAYLKGQTVASLRTGVFAPAGVKWTHQGIHVERPEELDPLLQQLATDPDGFGQLGDGDIIAQFYRAAFSVKRRDRAFDVVGEIVRRFAEACLPVTGPYAASLQPAVVEHLPLPGMNSCAIPASDGNYVIAHQGFHSFQLHLYALDSILRPFEGAALTIDEHVTQKTLLRCIGLSAMGRSTPMALKLLHSPLVLRPMLEVRPLYLGGDPAAIVRSMWAFVLLHEYGHIALGHADDARTEEEKNRLGMVPAASLSGSTVSIEVSADAFAVAAMFGGLAPDKTDEYSPELLIGILYFFLLIALAEESEPPTHETPDHVAAAARFRSILALVPKRSFLLWRVSPDDVFAAFRAIVSPVGDHHDAVAALKSLRILSDSRVLRWSRRLVLRRYFDRRVLFDDRFPTGPGHRTRTNPALQRLLDMLPEVQG